MQIFNGLKIHVPFVDKQEMDAEHARLEKELTRTSKELEGLHKKLDNPNFTARAPEHVVDSQRQKAKEAMHKKQALEQQLEKLLAAVRSS